MRRYVAFFGLLFFIHFGYAQSKFRFPKGITKDKISFEMINNLVIIPVKVNGVELTFLLDTGVNTTLIFSLSGIDSLALNNPKLISLRGLGDGESISAYSSTGNTIEVGKASDTNHKVNVVLDHTLNLSKRMGIPIHGILGYDFFEDFVVVTKYTSKKLIFYNPTNFNYKKCKKCVELPITFHNKKAYVPVTINQEKKEQLVLLDSGSSDAIWLFDHTDLLSDNPKNYFEDYLGSGLSGSVFGKRSKIKQVSLGDYTLKNTTVAFPDSIAFSRINLFDQRKGSIGGGILKRFTVILDYPSGKMIVKRNARFKDAFHYNMSGLTIEHKGVEVVKESGTVADEMLSIPDDRVSIPMSTIYKYLLVPKYVVAEVVKGSPADLAGVQKGDEITYLNGKKVYHYKLAELIEMFTSHEGKKITMILNRNGKIIKKKFYLKERIHHLE